MALGAETQECKKQPAARRIRSRGRRDCRGHSDLSDGSSCHVLLEAKSLRGSHGDRLGDDSDSCGVHALVRGMILTTDTLWSALSFKITSFLQGLIINNSHQSLRASPALG